MKNVTRNASLINNTSNVGDQTINNNANNSNNIENNDNSNNIENNENNENNNEANDINNKNEQKSSAGTSQIVPLREKLTYDEKNNNENENIDNKINNDNNENNANNDNNENNANNDNNDNNANNINIVDNNNSNINNNDTNNNINSSNNINNSSNIYNSNIINNSRSLLDPSEEKKLIDSYKEYLSQAEKTIDALFLMKTKNDFLQMIRDKAYEFEDANKTIKIIKRFQDKNKKNKNYMSKSVVMKDNQNNELEYCADDNENNKENEIQEKIFRTYMNAERRKMEKFINNEREGKGIKNKDS